MMSEITEVCTGCHGTQRIAVTNSNTRQHLLNMYYVLGAVKMLLCGFESFF